MSRMVISLPLMLMAPSSASSAKHLISENFWMAKESAKCWRDWARTIVLLCCTNASVWR